VRRLRFLRILLPLALVVFVVAVAMQLRPRPSAHRQGAGPGADGLQSGTGIEIQEFQGDREVLRFKADVVEQVTPERLHIENIERFAIFREGQQPLVVKGEVGDVEGPVGKRMMRFEQQVWIHDPDLGLVVTMPTLIVDEAAGEARSIDGIDFEGEIESGHAELMIYGLEGQPTQFFDLTIDDGAGGTLSSRQATLLDGFDDIELHDDVRALRGPGEHFEAERLRLLRGPNRRLKQARAAGGVSGAVRSESGGLLTLAGEDLAVDWDDRGEPERLSLERDAELSLAAQSLAARTILATCNPESGDWKIDARGTVYVQGVIGAAPAWLRSETLDALLDPRLELKRAQAEGQVRFDGPDLRAEGQRAILTDDGGAGKIELFAAEHGKARLARGRTRVAALRIVTDTAGEHLQAEEDVEANLLPAAEDDGATAGMFRTEEAVHFVSHRLDALESGSRLVFSGDVRGWQGEQNLSASRVTVHQIDNSMSAEVDVNTRFPREKDLPAAAEAHYIQISADRLDYDDSRRRATYEGNVRVRLVEGWLEASRVELDLAEAGQGIREVRAFQDVRMEFRNSADPDAPQMVAGKSDRMVYEPGDETVWMYGEIEPASVRRIGGGGGVTSGRVIRYRLDSGTLAVDSGEQGPARIRTSDRPEG